MPQEVVQRCVDVIAGQAEQDVNARGLDVRVDDPDAQTAGRDQRRQVGRGIGLASSPAKRVDAGDSGQSSPLVSPSGRVRRVAGCADRRRPIRL